MKVVELDEESKTRLVLFVVKNVQDITSLKDKIVNGQLDCCVIKASLIVNYFQIVVAAIKAVHCKKASKLATKCLNTELLFNLSISKNITQSLSKFGVDDKEQNIIVVVFEENGEDKANKIKSTLMGDVCDVEEIENLCNIELIKKTYKITEKELEVSTLLDSVVSRIATKECGSF